MSCDRGAAPDEVGGAFGGRALTAARRRGKAMWCETDGEVGGRTTWWCPVEQV